MTEAAAPKTETGTRDGGRRAGWKRALTFIIELLLLAGIAWALVQRRDDLARALDLDVVHVVLVLVLCAAAAPVRAVELTAVTRSLGVRMSLPESLALTQAATLLNYLPMQAGTLLRARVLKTQRSLSYARYVAVMSSLVLLAVGTGGVDGLLALPFATTLTSEVRTTAAIGFAVVTAVTVLILLLPLSRLRFGDSWLARRAHDLLEGWQLIKAGGPSLLVLVATAMSTPLLLGLRFAVCFHALSMPVGVPESLLLASAILVSAPVNVTPGGLGVRELIATAIGAAAGLDFAQVLAAVTLDRVISLAFSFVSGLTSWFWLKRRGLVG